MSINGVVLKEGATYTPTGGTSITFDDSGENVANGIVCVNQAENDFFAREKLVATSRLPSKNSDGTYSKQKVSVRIIVPETLADGTISYDLIRFETESSPFTAAGKIDTLRGLGMAVLNSTDLDNLFTVGSIK
jgi:hypothetical protein